MKIEVLEKTKTKLKVKFVGSDHTFLSPIVDYLLADKDVKSAYYKQVHPLKDEYVVLVETTKADPKLKLESAFEAFKADIVDLKNQIDKE